MLTRSAKAQWQGDLQSGQGTIELTSGTFKQSYNFGSRFEDGQGTNPEELIAAAHAGCFSMALAHVLAQAGYCPKSIQTTGKVSLEKAGEGFKISTSVLECRASVPDISQADFQSHAETAGQNCPVSQVLAGANITVKAQLSD